MKNINHIAVRFNPFKMDFKALWGVFPLLGWVFIFPVGLMAQGGFNEVWSQVEKNNTTLTAYKAYNEAEKLENLSGIYLPNPEAEFALLWGNPSSIGKRTNIALGQSFEFPTVYGHRMKAAKDKNNISDLEYAKLRYELRYQVKEICIRLIYFNALSLELETRYEHAKAISEAYSKMYEKGACNVLDYNKARLAMLNEKKAVETIGVESQELLNSLQGLNGGIPLEYKESGFLPVSVPVDFNQWYAGISKNNPDLSLMGVQTQVKQTEIALSRAMSLPHFSVGYMREALVEEQFQGFVVGMSIPLWENKNSVKKSKAELHVAECQAIDFQTRYLNEMQALYQKALSLQSLSNEYQSILNELNHTSLLRIALEKGEISLVDYLVELSLYYDTINKSLECQRDLQLVMALLGKYN